MNIKTKFALQSLFFMLLVVSRETEKCDIFDIIHILFYGFYEYVYLILFYRVVDSLFSSSSFSKFQALCKDSVIIFGFESLRLFFGKFMLLCD